MISCTVHSLSYAFSPRYDSGEKVAGLCAAYPWMFMTFLSWVLGLNECCISYLLFTREFFCADAETDSSPSTSSVTKSSSSHNSALADVELITGYVGNLQKIRTFGFSYSMNHSYSFTCIHSIYNRRNIRYTLSWK